MNKEKEPISLTEWAKRCRIIDEAGDFQQAEWDALCTTPSRERIVKVWSTPAMEAASRLFHRCNPAGNNQIEKAHFQKAWLAEAVASDKEGERLPSLMRPRINIQGTITGRVKAAPNIKG